MCFYVKVLRTTKTIYAGKIAFEISNQLIKHMITKGTKNLNSFTSLTLIHHSFYVIFYLMTKRSCSVALQNATWQEIFVSINRCAEFLPVAISHAK